MKNKIYIAIICAFSIVFAVSSGFLIKHYYDSAKQAEMYDNLIGVVETEPEETKEPMNYSEEKTFIPEYQELYLQNNDMVGWIKVTYSTDSLLFGRRIKHKEVTERLYGTFFISLRW